MRQISYAEEFQIIYIGYSTLKEVEHNSLLLKVWAVQWDFLPKNMLRKGRKNT